MLFKFKKVLVPVEPSLPTIRNGLTQSNYLQANLFENKTLDFSYKGFLQSIGAKFCI